MYVQGIVSGSALIRWLPLSCDIQMLPVSAQLGV